MNANENSNMPRRAFVRGLAAIGLLPLLETQAKAGDLAGVPVTEIPKKWPDADSSHYWPWIRGQFTIPSDQAYFNTGTLGASPRPVTEAMVDSVRNTEKTIADYDYRAEHAEYIAGYRSQLDLRGKAGGIMNASAAEIGLVQNATVALNLVAHGLDLKAGDEVLLTDQEHPGASGVWDLRAKHDGIVVKKLPITIPATDPQAIVKTFADAIGPKTKVIAVPHVTSRYGIVLPVKELCDLARAHSIFTLIDGAQALGMWRVNVKQIGCDAYAASPHKWLLAPPGNGLLFVREDRVKDVWATLASGHWNDYDAATGTFRLTQYGTASPSLLVGLDAAMDFYLRIGPERVEKRSLELANRLRAGLQQIQGVEIASPVHPALAGAIVTYGIDGVTGLDLQDKLWARKHKRIRVRGQGGKLVRQSVHYYNSPEEIDDTLEMVRALAVK